VMRAAETSVGSEAPAVGATPVFTQAQAIERLSSTLHDKAVSSYKAMYSSVLGGIVTDPALMVVPMDDHLVHRGHGIFDTALLTAGHLYQLDAHVDRFLRSAAKARLDPPMPREAIRQVILETAAASGLQDGEVRYWMGAGPGGFSLSPKECVGTSLYVMVISPSVRGDPAVGWKVVTTTVDIKSPYFATVKSNNYLPNALAVMDALDQGADQGIFIDLEGFIAEGPNMNIACLTQGGTLLVPPFDAVLDGCTVHRVMELASSRLGQGALEGVKEILVTKFTEEEAKGAVEVVMIGSGTMVFPVIEWGGKPVGDGRPGRVAAALRALIAEDMVPPGDQHVPVPYQ